MANRIEWFLVEVERRIEGKLSPRRAQSVSDELRDHLEASRDEFVQMGLDPQVAEGKAVATFGRPEVLSEQLLEPTIATTFGISTELLIKLIGVAMCVAFPFLTFGHNGPFSIGYSIWISAAFLLLVAYLFTRVQRLQTGSIMTFSLAFVIVLGAAFAQLTIYEPNTGLHSVNELGGTVHSYKQCAAACEKLEQLYSKGARVFSEPLPPIRPSSSIQQRVTPYLLRCSRFSLAVVISRLIGRRTSPGQGACGQ